jgi:hypothetical protein
MRRPVIFIFVVMAGLVPAIHAFLFAEAVRKLVDGPNKSGHDAM